MNKSDSISKLSAALVKAISEVKPVAFDKSNDFLKVKYATLGAVIDMAEPILHANGLAVTQFPCGGEANGVIGVESILVHESGEWISEKAFMEVPESEKGISRAQSAGKVISYLRRYALSAILMAYSEEDNDAQPTHAQAPKQQAINPPALDKVYTIEALAANVGKAVNIPDMNVAALHRHISELGITFVPGDKDSYAAAGKAVAGKLRAEQAQASAIQPGDDQHQHPDQVPAPTQSRLPQPPRSPSDK